MRDREAIPSDVRRFIHTSIPSVPYLEAMLLLRDAPDAVWDADTVAQRLYLDERTAAQLLGMLHAARVAVRANGRKGIYRYRPRSKALRQLIDRLAQSHSRHLVAISNLIHSRTGKRTIPLAGAFQARPER